MLRCLRLLVLVGTLLGWLASASAVEVKDDAGFFTADTVKKVNDSLREIWRLYNKDVLIETFKGIPRSKREAYDKATSKPKFFEDWALERARKSEINGIYVLVCKQPSYMLVEVGNQTRAKAFTLVDRNRLRDLMRERFRKKEYDDGLIDAVALVRTTLETNLGLTPPAEFARKLESAKVEQYAVVPAYSEGPIWRKNELLFCSNGLLRVTQEKQVRKLLDLQPNGTVLRADGHIIMCDNKIPALVDLGPDGKVGVVVEQFEGKKLNSLNDLTIDAAWNVYWTDPNGTSRENPTGSIFRVRPDGKVDRIASDLAYPNGIEVDPANKYLYVIESQTSKILRYDLPAEDKPLGKPTVWYALGGSGGDGCAFDAAGNLWVADFHRPDTKQGRIVVLSPDAQLLGTLAIPAKQVSNITFGGMAFDEIFVTTGEPNGVFHAKVGVVGFRGHPGKSMKIIRQLDIKPLDEPVGQK